MLLPWLHGSDSTDLQASSLGQSNAIDDRFGTGRKLPAACRIRQDQSATDDSNHKLAALSTRYPGGIALLARSTPGESGNP